MPLTSPIYDLNNVPLVHGSSYIKWHLPHSIHSSHHGRTAKCPIANHRVEYNYGKIIPVRLAIDKTNSLAECPIELEVLQEFPTAPPSSAGPAEYVEESEAFVRESGFRPRPSGSGGSFSGNASFLQPGTARPHPQEVQSIDHDGVIRRYLMTDSKINSTLKIGILMVQLDGERNYVAPPLKTAPVFGGITGMGITGSASAAAGVAGSKPGGDVYELQDMYRRALAASWAGHPGELAANECIEDIFQGGDGFGSDSDDVNHRQSPGDVTPRGHGKRVGPRPAGQVMTFCAQATPAEGVALALAEDGEMQRDTTPATEAARARDGSRDSETGSHRGGGLGMRGRSESLASLTTMIESERGRSGFKSARELNEWEVRDDLVAWRLPGTAS
ncbi:hypothetical protein M406DRAFT_62893 [Cryphonectria parasitica EP155]|uniref:C2 NT-type domain-containing protein n=1 Tax=Cryphonectria parasitica (strain ATCC 38755 / EP155) TaxID=660469 RepID=A0A9P4Y8U3_CRYP1|nr:uncharacterized protein M406DRAFT_62893 [Cryphonectria parasitica EP155]KAF3768871.1 hypothetical protein M406DRAFT_62893 [Cryphonectria parasitica EP155]